MFSKSFMFMSSMRLSRLFHATSRVNLKVGEILGPNSYFPQIQINKKLNEAINLLSSSHQPVLAVMEKDNLVGMFTEHDFISKVLRQGHNPDTMTIEQVSTMKDQLIVGSTKDTMEACMDVMIEKNLRYLPILHPHNKKLAGIISINELAQRIRQEESRRRSTSWLTDGSTLVDSIDYFSSPFDQNEMIESKVEAELNVLAMKKPNSKKIYEKTTESIVFTEPSDTPETVENLAEAEMIYQIPQAQNNPLHKI